MKSRIPKILACVLCCTAATANAALINVDTAGINITNTGGNGTVSPGNLQPFVFQGTDYDPGSNSEAQFRNWLDNTGTIQPGQIAAYNTITGSSLGQPGATIFDDDNASLNGTYSLTGGFSYYVTAHYGGSYVAWVVQSASSTDTFEVPGSIGDVLGATQWNTDNPTPKTQGQGYINFNPNQGLSNVTIWQGSRTPNDEPGPRGKVPDGGTTLLCFGLGLLGLGSMRKVIGARA